MLPFVPRFARQQIDRAWLQLQFDPIDAFLFPPTERNNSGGAKRDPDDVFEDQPVAVPADPSPGVVAYEKSLLELPIEERCELRCALAKRQQKRGSGSAAPKVPFSKS